MGATREFQTTTTTSSFEKDNQGQGQPSDETSLGYEDQDQGQPRVENNTIKTESTEYIKAPFHHQRQTCPAIRLSPSELRLDIVSARIYNLYFCIYVCVY